MSKKEKSNSSRVITQEWLDANGFSPLEEVRKRIEGENYPINKKKKG